MKQTKYFSIMLTAVLFAAILTVSALLPHGQHHTAGKSAAATPDLAASRSQAPDDMRGVWVTYMELSMQYEDDKSEAAFRAKFQAIADNCFRFGFNTLFVQVRPFCDALYASKLFPASHVLTGEQGKDAEYDALQIICDICRSRGLRVHAWVNPYRVTAGQTPEKLSAGNPVIKDETLALKAESGIILDPSSAKARRLITDGVREIVENYEVDGVQFDDYFYPEDIGSADSKQYQAYCDSAGDKAMDLAAWRCCNVNLLLSEIYLAVHRAKPSAVFGVSPQGSVENNAVLSADVISWCEKRGYIDYICPQLYYSPDNPVLGFEAALQQWTALSFSESVRLYGGLAGYKAGTDADEGTWQNRTDILAGELNVLKKNQKVSGFLLYSYTSLLSEAAHDEMKALKETLSAAQP